MAWEDLRGKRRGGKIKTEGKIEGWWIECLVRSNVCDGVEEGGCVAEGWAA